jgi:hypothetical protein
MDIKYKVSPKKIERIRERQTALLDELEDLMMQRFASEPERYGADYDSRDETESCGRVGGYLNSGVSDRRAQSCGRIGSSMN